MIPRLIENQLLQALRTMPVVAILGLRQVGKTTLALEITRDKLDKEVAYLDLERDSDLAKLEDPEAYLANGNTATIELQLRLKLIWCSKDRNRKLGR